MPASGDLGMFGVLAYDNGDELIVHGSLAYAITTANRFNFNAGSTLTMLAGSLNDCDALEIAGRDDGDVPNGFTSNFEIDHLRIGADGHVHLTDAIDNGQRNGPAGTNEALYVNTLECADPNGRLYLDGLNLYYNTLVGNPEQIDPGSVTNGGVCQGGAGSGDPDGNGVIDLTDLSILFSNLRGPEIVTCGVTACFDFDFDADNDVRDFASFQLAYTSD